jgi:hypothetical protein
MTKPSRSSGTRGKRQESKLAVVVSLVIFWLAIWLILIPNEEAGACSLAPLPIRCTVESSVLQSEFLCLNENCSLKAERNAVDGLTIFNLPDPSIEPSYEYYAGEIQSNGIYLDPYSPIKPKVEMVDQICDFDLSSAPKIYSLYDRWDVRDTRGFTIEPTSDVRIQDLQTIKHNLLSCWDVDFVTEDDTLASFGFSRSYCGETLSLLSLPCGGGATVLSPIKFITHIFLHPDVITLPYVGASLILFALIFSSLHFLQKRGDLGLFLIPGRVHLWGLIIGIPILCFLSIGIASYFGYLLLGYYIALCIVNYSRVKRDSS